ncbi:MAG: DUF433 domain-containing protein [Tepidiformaceae bacterium]
MSATASEVDIGTLIQRKPGVNGGRPCLAGTGTSVLQMSVMHRIWGLSAEEILEQYPHLDLMRIYAALAYYHANKAAIDADLEEEARAYDAAVAEIEEKERAARQATG